MSRYNNIVRVSHRKPRSRDPLAKHVLNRDWDRDRGGAKENGNGKYSGGIGRATTGEGPGTKGPKKPNENPTQTAGNPKQETGQSDVSSGICKASLAPVRWEEVVRGRGEGLSACINATGLQMLVRHLCLSAKEP